MFSPTSKSAFGASKVNRRFHESGWDRSTTTGSPKPSIAPSLKFPGRLSYCSTMKLPSLFACITVFFMLDLEAADPSPPGRTPKIQAPSIDEASGLAISRASADYLWIINDSGGGPDIHLVTTDGSDCGLVRLQGAPNIDWEDLASFSLDGVPYLLVADTGDNGAKRDSCVLYILREPKIPAKGKSLEGTVRPAWQITFRYEGGPRDCESVGVDPTTGKILLISKRTTPPEVYELPLRSPKRQGIQTARKIGQVVVKSPLGDLVPVSNQPTGLDLAADQSTAAVVTYYGVFLFPRSAGESWSAAFTRRPAAIRPHLLAQAESVAFSKDGKTLFTISEGPKSPIVSFPR